MGDADLMPVCSEDCGKSFITTRQRAAGARFTDLDLDPEDIGGWVTWEPPVLADRLEGHTVYLSVGEAGTVTSQVGGLVPVGTNTILVPADTPARASTGEKWNTVLVYEMPVR